MIKIIYTLFIGILLATSIGIGIAAFYPAPPRPEYPNEFSTAVKEPAQQTVADLEKQRDFEQKYKQYEKSMKAYNGNVALLAVSFSLVFLIVSVVLIKKLDFIADSVLLGGLLILIYGVIRSFGSGELKLIFALTVCGLFTSLVVGYLKFIRPDARSAPSR